MNRRAKVELFEQIRREHEFGGASVRAIARKFQVHRRLVRQALASALPPERTYSPRACPRLDPVKPFIDGILQADQKAPRKQRHTAQRIYRRICQEQPQYPVGRSRVGEYVRQRKQELGLLARETFVPQSYGWGVEGQVDWYEACVDLSGERTKLYIFCLRSMASGAAFHCAYPRATQQAFLEAHERAFAYWGGVFQRLRYDNLTAAVKKIVRGQRREETTRFIAFRSHWRFEASFCTPGQGHEKGGVEGEAGYFRRNYLVPVPSVKDLAEVNALLLAACRHEEQRVLAGRSQSVGEAMTIERDHLLPMATEGFDLVDVSFPTVDASGCVRVKTNSYSVPLSPGWRVQAKTYASSVEIWYQGQRIACHERCYSRKQQVLDLEHYLDVLERKPGAFAGSKPLEQWRQQGRWPASYDAFWHKLMQRYGRQNGTREMVELLQFGKRHGYDQLQKAVETALDLGCSDAGAVRYLLGAEGQQRPQPEPVEIGTLARYERPLPRLNHYDELLQTRATV
jgi:transposase